MKNTRLCWDDYFMYLALLTSHRSEDPNTKVGAVLVDEDNRLISVGYNGFPRGTHSLPWNRDGNDELNKKYLYVVHGEANCILNCNIGDLSKTKLYCTLFPCNECAKIIIQRGIKYVHYLDDKYHNTSSCIASKKMFDMTNVKYIKHQFKINDLNGLLTV